MLGAQDRTIPTCPPVVSIEDKAVASYRAQLVPGYGQDRFREDRPVAVGSCSEALTALPLSCVGSAIGGDGRREGQDPPAAGGPAGSRGQAVTCCTPFQSWQAWPAGRIPGPFAVLMPLMSAQEKTRPWGPWGLQSFDSLRLSRSLVEEGSAFRLISMGHRLVEFVWEICPGQRLPCPATLSPVPQEN